MSETFSFISLRPMPCARGSSVGLAVNEEEIVVDGRVQGEVCADHVPSKPRCNGWDVDSQSLKSPAIKTA
jgi:hypothetical protein